MPIWIGLANKEKREREDKQPAKHDLKEKVEDALGEVENPKSKPSQELASKPSSCESGDDGDGGEDDEGDHCFVKSLNGQWFEAIPKTL